MTGDIHQREARRLLQAAGTLMAEDAMRHLEAAVELAVFGATHLFNDALHRYRVSDEVHDQLHSDMPDHLRERLPAGLDRFYQALVDIEELRTRLVRGGERADGFHVAWFQRALKVVWADWEEKEER
jgi:cation transport regulator ChaB